MSDERAMACPSCAYRSPFDRVCCPRCRTIFDAAQLEELTSLRRLPARVERWQADGSLTPEAASTILDLAARDRERLERALAAGGAVADGEKGRRGEGEKGGALPLPSPHPPISASPAPRPPGPPAPLPTPGRRWSGIATALLSERTLHALLGLGALLILASGAVISTLNPTGLGPLPHLAAVLATTALFYAAGAVVRGRLKLVLTGVVLLAIGGAFIPLSIWTLGTELLGWEGGAIWLAASLVCLPVYLASYALLRDRTFGLLAALAGGSELLAALSWLGVPLEWGLCALVGLAIGYLRLAGRPRVGRPALGWALFWTAQVAVPLVLVTLMAARLAPIVYEVAVGRSPGGGYEYAVGLAWWLGALFYALAARWLGARRYVFAAAWTLPVAFLFTLTKAPWGSDWYNLLLALLAGSYLAAEWWRRRSTGVAEVGLRRAVGEPLYQVGLALTVAAALWPFQTRPSAIATLLTLAIIYCGAATLLRWRAWAYVGVYLVPVATSLLGQELPLEHDRWPLAWAGLTGGLLGLAEVAARRSGEARRPLAETALGLGDWRSRFAGPLFSAGYGLSLVALWSGLVRYWAAPAAAGTRQVELPVILGLAAVVATYGLSALARRTSFFLYPATWLLLVPFNGGLGLLARRQGWSLAEHDLARVLAVLALGYLALGLALGGRAERWARPFALVGYALLPLVMLLSALDRTANVQVVGLALAVFAGSAWLAHHERHPSFRWLLGRVFRDPASGGYRGARALFLYLATWLFPAWLLLALSLREPGPAVADYGLALTLLAPVYAACGRWLGRLRSEDRPPWYLAGYALSVVGPLVTSADSGRLVVALGISILLYAASAVVSRHSGWLYPVALLAPVWLWQALDHLALFDRFYGLGLVGLGLLYGGVGLALHLRLSRPPSMTASIAASARPFFIVGYALVALGLARVANQERELLVIGFLLAALQYGGSAYLFRERLFGYPLAATVAVAYAVGMTLTPLEPRFYGLGLMPAVIAFRAVAERARRADGGWRGRRPLDSWAAPFALAAALGVLAVPFLSSDAGAGATTAIAYALVLGALAIGWRSEVEAWASFGMAALAYHQFHRLLGLAPVEQAPRWALAALLLSLLGMASRRVAPAVWRRTLAFGPMLVGAGAMLGALLVWLAVGGRPGVQGLAATCAVSGLTLVAYGLDRRERLLGYLGVALVEAGYMLQLVLFDVGQPQAFALPAGLYLLGVAYLEWRRGSRDPSRGVLEAGGLALLLVTTLIQAVGFLGDGLDRHAYATLLLVEAAALFGLGAVLHWRRSFFAGAVAIVVDLGILLADPLRAMNTWYLVAVLGLAMIGLVIFVEQRRRQIPVWLDEWRERLESWD